MPINIYSIQPIYVFLCIWMHVYLYMCVCVCACACMCICLCVYVCVCVALSIVCNSAGAQSVRGATTISGSNCSVEPCMKLFCGSV